MSDLSPLINAVRESHDEEERDILGNLIVGLCKGLNYPKHFYESGQAIDLLSPKAYAALKEVMEPTTEETEGARGDERGRTSTHPAPGAREESKQRPLVVCALTDCPLLLKDRPARKKRATQPPKPRALPLRSGTRGRGTAIGEQQRKSNTVKVKGEKHDPKGKGILIEPKTTPSDSDSDSSLEVWEEACEPSSPPPSPIDLD